MRKRSIAGAVVVGVVLAGFAATSAQAAVSQATTPDKASWVYIETHGNQAIEVTLQDSSCDGRGPILYYKVGSQSSYSTIKNGKGCGGTVHTWPSVAAPKGVRVVYYLCNVNDAKGYRSCTETRQFYGD